MSIASLEKASRRLRSTSESLSAILCSAEWNDDSLDKTLDKWLKADAEYWDELKRLNAPV